MSEIIYQEQVTPEVAEPLIGTDNLKDGATYYLITSVDNTTVMRKTKDGDEVEFRLKEPEFTGYSDGIDFAKFKVTRETDKPSKIGLYILIMMVTALIGGLTAMAYLLINFA